MRLLPILVGAASLLISFAYADTSLPVATDILYWPVGSPQPSVLARVAYDPASLESEVVSYHPPSDDRNDGLVRVGLYTSTLTTSKQWVGSLASLSSLTGDGPRPALRLHLGPASQVYHVSLAGPSAPAATASAAGPEVQLVANEPGTQPHLNRPVVVGPGGQNTEEVVEKSFFQKYWWVFLIIAFLSMAGSGEGQS